MMTQPSVIHWPLSDAQRNAITAQLAGRHISAGLGTTDEPCSVAAINLALTGELTASIPECMSAVIGWWIIRVQDAMPDAMRNSAQWRHLLPLAAGTGRDRETERLTFILEWMWETVLPCLQPIADRRGFGREWVRMCNQRTEDAAVYAIRAAAIAAAYSAEDAAAAAANAAQREIADDIGLLTDAQAAAQAAASVADTLAINDAADNAAIWTTFDPCGLLARLVEL